MEKQSIIYIFKINSNVAYYFGLACFKIRKNKIVKSSKKSNVLTILFHGVALAIATYFLMVGLFSHFESNNLLIYLLSKTFTAGVYLILFFNITTYKIYHETRLNLLQTFLTLDKHFDVLGITFDNRRIKLWSWIGLIPEFIQLVLFLLSYPMTESFVDVMSSVTVVVYLSTCMAILTSDFFIYYNLICIIIDAVNVFLLKQTKSDLDDKLNAQKSVNNIRVVMKMYTIISGSLKDINKILALPMIGLFTVYFGTTILQVYSILSFVFDNPSYGVRRDDYRLRDVISICMWFTYAISRLLIYLFASENYEISISNLTRTLLKVFTRQKNILIRKEINAFLLQTKHEHININVAGLFKLGNKLAISMIGTIITYTVILLQYDHVTFDLDRI